MIRFLAFVALICSTSFAFSQNKVILMNGKEMDGFIVGEDSTYIKYKYVKDGVTEEKERLVYKDRIFSLIGKDGKETFYYEQDSTKGNERSIDEMRSFIKGEKDAWAGYKTPITFIATTVVSGGGTYGLLTQFDGAFLSLAVPLATYFGSMAFQPKLSAPQGFDANMASDQHYEEGFQRVAKGKKNSAGLKGSLVGGILGFGGYFLMK